MTKFDEYAQADRVDQANEAMHVALFLHKPQLSPCCLSATHVFLLLTERSKSTVPAADAKRTHYSLSWEYSAALREMPNSGAPTRITGSVSELLHIKY